MTIPPRIPGVVYGPTPKAATVAGALTLPPRLIVIHDTGNTATAVAEAHYAATRTDSQSLWTSCHAYIDAGGVLGSTPLTTQAWAAFSYANHNGWHLEMCGLDAGGPGAVPPGTVARTAQLVAQLCDLAGIPKVHLGPADVAAGKRGITGHWDITQGLHVGDHSDPGRNFDWAAFIAAVNSHTANAQGVDVEETLRVATNGDKWGLALTTMTDPAKFLGSDAAEHTTENKLAQAIRDIQTKVTSLSVGGVDIDALVAKVVAGVIASHDALTTADAPVITDAVKAALRAGTG